MSALDELEALARNPQMRIHFYGADMVDADRVLALVKKAKADRRYPEAERSYLSQEWERLAQSFRKRAKDAEAERDAAIARAEMVGAELKVAQDAAITLNRELDTATAHGRVLSEAIDQVRELADKCASSGCIHLNDLWGRLNAALGGG